MTTRASLLTLLLLGALATALTRAQAPDPIDTIVREAMEAQRIPGLALAVIRGGHVLKAQGYGLASLEHDLPVTDRTIFQSGSIGKQFTAAAIMLLADDGRLTLDDRVTRFYPEAPEAWRAITIRHLLTHTSGIPNYTAGLVDYRRDYTEDDLATLAFDLPLDFAPGAEWRYSNTGYVLLGAIIGKLTGAHYGEFLRERIFEPAGMTTARIISEADLVPHRAAGYRLVDGRWQNQAWVSPVLNTTADGSLYLSLRDYLAWDAVLRAQRLLTPAGWSATFEPVQLTSGRRYPYGLGWEVDRLAGRAVQRHGGSWQGFQTHLARYLDDDVTIVVLTNLAQARPSRISDAIAAHLVPTLGERPTWTIVGAEVADGTGGPLRRASVRIEGDRIVAVGTVTPAPNDRIIDATGFVVAPGFIDMHNHSDNGIEREPGAVSQISQGITTLLLGQDGSSPFPLGEYLDRRRATPPAVNVAVLVGHATVRRQVMGDDFRRTATRAEIRRMEALVDQEMRAGAVGLSSGLEYEVGSYASTEEVTALARLAARHGGFYISHIRDEADRTLEAVREAILIGERARLPVQITHIKLGTVGVWGQAGEVVRLIEAARRRGVDVVADAYPYLAWSSNLKVLVPSRQWTDPASVQKALDDVGGGKNIQITRLPMFPEHVGRRLSEAAEDAGLSEVDFYIRIVVDEEAGVIGHTMSEPDLRVFYEQPWTMVASDGGIGARHPRGAGTFPRVLGRFVREEGWMSLPEAIRRMTSLPASRLGLADRGLVREGLKADLVVFDPATIIDHSTFEDPARLSRGVHAVFVNGAPVWLHERPTEERPGVVLRKR
jgi:N-acyl-D-amino-acid deacylase